MKLDMGMYPRMSLVNFHLPKSKRVPAIYIVTFKFSILNISLNSITINIKIQLNIIKFKNNKN